MAKKEMIEFTTRLPMEWKDGNVSFALDLPLANGQTITIYNCRITKGKSGKFIGFPSRKGTDGKYYSHVYFELSEELTEAIINDVYDQLDAQEKPKKLRR